MLTLHALKGRERMRGVHWTRFRLSTLRAVRPEGVRKLQPSYSPFEWLLLILLVGHFLLFVHDSMDGYSLSDAHDDVLDNVHIREIFSRCRHLLRKGM